jgi:hypothetical protein
MSFSYDLKLVIVAYRAALGGDLGGGIFGPFCEELGGRESCVGLCHMPRRIMGTSEL